MTLYGRKSIWEILRSQNLGKLLLMLGMITVGHEALLKLSCWDSQSHCHLQTLGQDSLQ